MAGAQGRVRGAIWAAHRRDVRRGSRIMTAIHLGVVAGGFARLPGRLLRSVFFG